ncbi:MAG: restriction endonuclease subunit M [Flavobacteriia bacterium]|nr:restriction endonuclease subunit M [Flavobacteriia bacterium]
MSLIDKGILAGLISFDEERKVITYIYQNKKRNFTNPEEQVQAETFCALVLQYNYPVERIVNFVSVKMGVETKEADIVVYNDDELTEPHILVECKKKDITEQEFLQAIEQAYSYAYALPNQVKFVWVSSMVKNEYFEVDKGKHSRIILPDIPQYGVKKLANYKFVYEAESLKTEKGKQKFFDLQIIDEEDLTRRFKQAHDSLWGGGQLNPSEAFDELDKLIFCKIWDEKKDRLAGVPYDFQIITIDPNEIKDDVVRRNKENDNLSERVRKLYEEGRKKDPEVFRDNIRLSPEKIRTVVGYLQDINIGETDLDAKGRAFETFMGAFFRGNFGQYFTPRPIVDFTVGVLPITNEDFVLDTSCGSGGFLLYALNKVRKQADALYPRHKSDVNQKLKHFRYWHDFAEKNLFGIEINEQISRAAKMNMIIHDDGHTNVITADGLLNPQEIEKLTANKGFKFNHFNYIITNPPFGSIVKQTEKAYLKEFNLGKKEEDWLALSTKPATNRENQNTEILFIEQCYNFLAEGGYLAIVIPDGILTNSSLQYVRDNIEETFRIVAVVSIPQTAFTATGAGVKCSVLFLRKLKSSTTDKIREIKSSLKFKIIQTTEFKKKCEEFEKNKKIEIKKLEHQYSLKNPTANKKEIAEAIKEAKVEIQSKYSDLLNEFKEQLQNSFIENKRKKLPDYKIFMAIANDIGYDATGKKTNNNELNTIGVELEKFIVSIKNEDL